MNVNLDFAALDKIFESGTKEELAAFCVANSLKIENGLVKAINQEDTKAGEVFWDKRQLVRKILLNSLYGALLNAGSRFFDFRLGQSTTLTGRGIDKHMASQINEIITGEYKHDGDAILYCDTDSSYFSAYSTYKPQIDAGLINWNKDVVVELYDAICEQANDTFVEHMYTKHHCPEVYGKIIRAGREIIAEKALFVKKKKYAILVYDDDGKRLDKDGKPGKVKVTGLDIKRSDTPAYAQDFLEEIVTLVLTGAQQNDIKPRIAEFREEFRKFPAWEKGSPKQVNNLTKYTNEWKKTGKCRVGHALAAINYNQLRMMHNDQYSMPIVDSMKTIVCKLKPNQLNMTSISIPTDEKRIPDWFKALPFDDDLMEKTIIDMKLNNLIGCLKWDLEAEAIKTTFNDLFDF
jgi:hypothetical protein